MQRDLYMWCMAKTIDPDKYRAKPRGRGRPPIGGGRPMTQITVRLTDELLGTIDAIIDDREGMTDRGAVIREFLAKGFKVVD